MTNSIAQTNLKEPERVDWDTAFAGGKYTPPPAAMGPDGKLLVHYVKMSDAKEIDDDNGYLNYQIDFEFTQGQTGRTRAWVSAKPFQRKNRETGELEPMKGNPNKLASFLLAAGLQAKPQSNAEYRMSVKAVNGKAIPVTIDWEASNREKTEKVTGYLSFPVDPATGNRKAVLRRGDIVNVIDDKGNITGTREVDSEVLFANARIKYFQSPTPKVNR